MFGNAPTQTQLTERQTQVRHLLAAGKPNKATCRGFEEGTVKADIASRGELGR